MDRAFGPPWRTRTGPPLAFNNHVMDSTESPLDPPNGESSLGPGMEFLGPRTVHAPFVDSNRPPPADGNETATPLRGGSRKLFPFPANKPQGQHAGAGPQKVVSYSQEHLDLDLFRLANRNKLWPFTPRKNYPFRIHPNGFKSMLIFVFSRLFWLSNSYPRQLLHENFHPRCHLLFTDNQRPASC